LLVANTLVGLHVAGLYQRVAGSRDVDQSAYSRPSCWRVAMLLVSQIGRVNGGQPTIIVAGILWYATSL